MTQPIEEVSKTKRRYHAARSHPPHGPLEEVPETKRRHPDAQSHPPHEPMNKIAVVVFSGLETTFLQGSCREDGSAGPRGGPGGETGNLGMGCGGVWKTLVSAIQPGRMKRGLGAVSSSVPSKTGP